MACNAHVPNKLVDLKLTKFLRLWYCVVFFAESAKSKNKPKAAGMDTIMRTARLQQEPPTSTGPSLAKSVGSKYLVYSKLIARGVT